MAIWGFPKCVMLTEKSLEFTFFGLSHQSCERRRGEMFQVLCSFITVNPIELFKDGGG